MFTKTQLVFDVAAPLEGDKVGAHVLSADGTAITSTGTSLDVNVTSAINVSVSHTDDSIKIGDGTDFLAINNDGSINAVVTATDLDIRNLSSGQDSVAAVQGGSWTVAATQSGTWTTGRTWNLASGSDSVDAVQSGTWNVGITGTATVSDAALANTAILNTQKNVTTTSGALLASQQANRKYLYVQNLGGSRIYVGASGVTTSDGIELGSKTLAELRLGAALSLHAVASSGTQDIRLMELS